MIFINPYAGVNQDIPNVGLAYAATYFNTKVIDLNTLIEPRDRYLNFNTDILGISVQSRTYSQAKEITQRYKSKYPKAQIKSVSGFLDIQCCYPYIDFEDKISYDEPFSDNYPFPNYELFDSFALFKKKWQEGIWGYAIMTSLGCPFRCSYCMSKERSWQARSAKNCYEELKLAREKWQIKSFVVIDDCFNVDIDRVMEFCRLVKPLSLNWACNNGLRADRFNEDMAKVMSEAGCKNISFGVESADNTVLKAVNKQETIEQIEEAIDIAKRYFDKVGGFFIIGLPGSSYGKDLNSLRWAMKKRINAHFSYYVPFDRAMQYDALFYGKDARPLSAEYPKKLQKKLYEKTAFMRGRIKSISNLIKYVLLKIRFILKFDILCLFKHIKRSLHHILIR